MKKSYLTALLTLACLFGLGISAGAQDVDGTLVTVPFEFVAGRTTLPAGEYKISLVNPGVNRALAIYGYNKRSAFLLSVEFDSGGSADQPTLLFENIGGRYFLSKINTLGGVYTLATPPKMSTLAQTKTQTILSSSGTN
jgi:hypothetical protein